MFAVGGLGFEKWALVLELLSNITANMFLLAVVTIESFAFLIDLEQ